MGYLWLDTTAPHSGYRPYVTNRPTLRFLYRASDLGWREAQQDGAEAAVEAWQTLRAGKGTEGVHRAAVHRAPLQRALHLQPRLDGVRRICRPESRFESALGICIPGGTPPRSADAIAMALQTCNCCERL